jgi:hypothetical protein
MLRKLDEKDVALWAENPDFDRLDLDMHYVVRTWPGLTTREIVKKLVEMGRPREKLEE